MAFQVFLLPSFAQESDLTGKTVVVIDVLRATTTITAALAAGAREVIPCFEVDEARHRARELGSAARLGGERGGERIDGFDFGNSPLEYTSSAVGGRSVVFTTTNGTRAMQRCRGARRVLLGAFVNLSALVKALRDDAEVALVCAGTDGHVTSEDVLFAGAVVRVSATVRGDVVCGNDEAWLARAAWDGIESGEGSALEESLAQSRGGRNLAALGMSPDILWSARRDATSVVGALDLAEWRIQAISAEK